MINMSIYVTKLRSGFGVYGDDGILRRFSKREMYSMTTQELINIIERDDD